MARPIAPSVTPLINMVPRMMAAFSSGRALGAHETTLSIAPPSEAPSNVPIPRHHGRLTVVDGTIGFCPSAVGALYGFSSMPTGYHGVKRIQPLRQALKKTAMLMAKKMQYAANIVALTAK